MSAIAVGMFVITMYGVHCGVKPNHPTTAGTLPVVGFTIAADPDVLPIGSIVEIEGFGERMVHDTGPMVNGQHLDVFVESCKAARDWGRKRREVKVTHWGGGARP